MEFLPIKTKVIEPPQDDFYAVLDESVVSLAEGDVVCVSSKVVAIHQGRCVPIQGTDKNALIAAEAEHIIPTDYRPFPLTVKFNTFLGAAGIDESNGNGYYILPPLYPFLTAREIRDYLKKRHRLNNLGVIITDSHSVPFRLGALGVAIAFWGFAPLESHIGKRDLFGREIKYERSNLADAIAAGAGLVSGEVAECQPIVIVRKVPEIVYTNQNHQDDLMVPPKEDTFRVLYERWLK